MYSQQLRNMKVRTDAQVCRKRKADTERAMSKKEFIDALNNFCVADDLVGITPTSGCMLFNQYLKEIGKPMTGRSTFSRMVKETFNMRLKHVRTSYGTYAYVFVIDEEAEYGNGV